jgi:hypothetical protein
MKYGDRCYATATGEPNRSDQAVPDGGEVRPDHRSPRRGPKKPPMTKRAEKSASPVFAEDLGSLSRRSVHAAGGYPQTSPKSPAAKLDGVTRRRSRGPGNLPY